MSNTDQLGALEYEQEGTWCATSAFSATHRPPILDPLDLSGLEEQSIDPEQLQQQFQGGTSPVRGTRGGSFKTKHWLHGHGGVTSGAVTIDPVETFWGFAWGNPSLAEANSCPTRSAASGTTAAGGSTTTNVVTAASGTFAKNSLCRIGTSGLSADGRGGGQFYPVNNHTGTNLALKHATILAANAADVVHSAVNFYLPETPTANGVIKSWRGRWLTPDQRYLLKGIYPTGITLAGLAPGEVPTKEFEWGVSDWDDTAGGTFPSAVASNQYTPAPNAGGSFIVGDVGSTVRTDYCVRAFSVTIGLGVHPFPCLSAVGPRQRYESARRTPSEISWSFTVDAPTAAAANIWKQKYEAGTKIWINASLSTESGSAKGIWMQNCCITKVAVQTSVDGMNAVVVEGRAYAGSDTSTEMSQAALVLAVA